MAFPAGLAFAAPFIGQGLNFLGNKLGANAQQDANLYLAGFQHDRNWDMLQYMNQYNSPAAQRKRFEDAGLNPALMYGQGTPGNMQSAPQYPNIQPADFQRVTADLGTKLQAAMLMKSQTDLTNQKVNESGVKQDLMQAQQNLIKANPHMKPEYVNSIVSIMSSAADVKQSERNVLLETQSSGYNLGQEKILNEVKLLEQRFKLGQSDQTIKAKVIESKEFQNALSEIQLKWMRDKEITPQHIYMGIMMLLQKLM